MANGCDDPAIPSQALIHREGVNLTISCPAPSDVTWEITCHDGQWLGTYGNCSEGKWKGSLTQKFGKHIHFISKIDRKKHDGTVHILLPKCFSPRSLCWAVCLLQISLTPWCCMWNSQYIYCIQFTILVWQWQIDILTSLDKYVQAKMYSTRQYIHSTSADYWFWKNTAFKEMSIVPI